MQDQHGEVPQQTLLEAVQHVVQAGCAMAFEGQPDNQTDHLTWCWDIGRAPSHSA